MQEPHTQSGNSPSMNGGKNRTFGAHAPARKRLLCPTGWRALTRGLEERSSESDGTEETDQEEKSWGDFGERHGRPSPRCLGEQTRKPDGRRKTDKNSGPACYTRGRRNETGEKDNPSALADKIQTAGKS
jgi:hypothetical protein